MSIFILWLLQVLFEELSFYQNNRILLSRSQYFHIHAVLLYCGWQKELTPIHGQWLLLTV